MPVIAQWRFITGLLLHLGGAPFSLALVCGAWYPGEPVTLFGWVAHYALIPAIIGSILLLTTRTPGRRVGGLSLLLDDAAWLLVLAHQGFVSLAWLPDVVVGVIHSSPWRPPVSLHLLATTSFETYLYVLSERCSLWAKGREEGERAASRVFITGCTGLALFDILFFWMNRAPLTWWLGLILFTCYGTELLTTAVRCLRRRGETNSDSVQSGSHPHG